MSTFANSEDPDKMPHNVAFHQDILSLVNKTILSPLVASAGSGSVVFIF